MEPSTSCFLSAWYDPVSGVQSSSACIAMADLYGDGDSKLLVADRDRKLSVYKGTSMVSEHVLLDVPVAIVAYYPEDDSRGSVRVPTIAVAAGPHIFIYRNLRPHYKFVVPAVEIDPAELQVWEKLAQPDAEPGSRFFNFDINGAYEVLSDLRDHSGIQLTNRSLDLLAIEEPAAALAFVEAELKQPLQQLTVITCMEVMKTRNEDDNDKGVSNIVIGTESKEIFVLKPSGYQVACQCTLKSVPVSMAITGWYDGGYRIVVVCRDSNVYTIKGEKTHCERTSNAIELDSPPCGLVRIHKSIVLGCMSNQLHSFHIKGKKNWTVYLPASITDMTLLTMKGSRKVQCVVVALANGELRVYNGKLLVSTSKLQDVVTGMRFGRFGREDHSLILTFRGGGMAVKMLPRTANLERSLIPAGPPPEQEEPLKVPKKTKLYVEQTQREQETAMEMHRVFQRDLCKLRLTTARAYVKMLTDGHGPLSYTSGSSLRLSAHVQGLGPLFKIKLGMQNTGNRPIFDIPVCFAYNQRLYKLRLQQLYYKMLVPGVQYKSEVPIEQLDVGPGAGAGSIRIFVLSPKSAVPVVTATVQMPASSFE